MGCGTAPGILIYRETMRCASDGVSEWLWIEVTEHFNMFVDISSPLRRVFRKKTSKEKESASAVISNPWAVDDFYRDRLFSRGLTSTVQRPHLDQVTF